MFVDIDRIKLIIILCSLGLIVFFASVAGTIGGLIWVLTHCSLRCIS